MTDINDSAQAQIPDALGSTNRGYDTVNTSPILEITLEKINSNLTDYIQNFITPAIDDNGVNHPVPVLYGNPERWASVRKDGYLRDVENDKLLTPLIMLTRKSIKQGKLVNPNNKYLYQTITSQWNNRNAYDKYAVQNNIRPSQKIMNIVIPDYMDLTYDVLMWTEYQSQMDTLIEQINVENYEFWGTKNSFKFQISIAEFEGDSQLPASKDRVVRTHFQMLVKAYLIPDKILKNFKLDSFTQTTFTKKKLTMTETIING